MRQCTLFCQVDDPSRLLVVTAELLQEKPELEGPSNDWSVMVVERQGYQLRIVRTPSITPGDKLSKILLGMVNWLERVATRHARATPVAVKRVFKTKALLGITGTPELSEELGHFDYVFALAEAADALVWNGSALLTPEGDLLVNAAGETES